MGASWAKILIIEGGIIKTKYGGKKWVDLAIEKAKEDGKIGKAEDNCKKRLPWASHWCANFCVTWENKLSEFCDPENSYRYCDCAAISTTCECE